MGVIAISDAPLHVLAVDDSNLDRKLIERLLKTFSYHVTAVDSGSKALEFLGLQDVENLPSFSSNQVCVHPEIQRVLRINFDYQKSKSTDFSIDNMVVLELIQEIEVNLIITDYCMPEMTGFELMRKIKESKSLKDIPVVIMSSDNIPARINRCLEEGAQEFFIKPEQLSDVDKLKPFTSKNKMKTSDEEECVSSDKSRARYDHDDVEARSEEYEEIREFSKYQSC